LRTPLAQLPLGSLLNIDQQHTALSVFRGTPVTLESREQLFAIVVNQGALGTELWHRAGSVKGSLKGFPCPKNSLPLLGDEVAGWPLTAISNISPAQLACPPTSGTLPPLSHLHLQMWVALLVAGRWWMGVVQGKEDEGLRHAGSLQVAQ
jgi:hypothetical protein